VAIQRVHIHHVSDRGAGPHWLQVLRSTDWMHDGEVLKTGSGGSVHRAQLKVGGVQQDVVIKTIALNTLSARLKSWFRQGRADRHLRNARRLTQVGIPSPEVLLLGSSRIDAQPHDILIMRRHPGAMLLSVMQQSSQGRLNPRQEHMIARAVGEQVALFAIAALFNRDYKPSNIMLEVQDGSVPSLAVIDCVAVYAAPIRGGGARRMFASLMIEPTGLGIPPRRTLRMRALKSFLERIYELSTSPTPAARNGYRQIRRALWDEVSNLIAAHGDMTPRDNPLAPPAASR
jgi:tRNA A-37 threonylcarbamoyl transferase component Bud32